MKRNAATHVYRHLPYMEINNAEKDIGVVIDDKLLFSQHMAEKVNKANSVLGAIRRSFEFRNTNTFKKLYSTLGWPHIEYAHAVWNTYKKKNIFPIEYVQKRATMMVQDYHIYYTKTD